MKDQEKKFIKTIERKKKEHKHAEQKKNIEQTEKRKAKYSAIGIVGNTMLLPMIRCFRYSIKF